MNEEEKNNAEVEKGVGVQVGQAGLLVLAIALIAWIGYGAVNNKTISQRVSPDQVVAMVNNEPIKRAELDRRLTPVEEEYKAKGTPFDDATRSQMESQVLNSIVDEELLLQAAKSMGVVVTPKAIDDEYQKLVAQLGGDDAFAKALDQYNLTPELIRTEIERQLLIEAYLNKDMGISVDQVTDEDRHKAYDKLTSSLDNPPSFESVSDSLDQYVLDEYRQKKASEIVSKLRSSSKIDVLLDQTQPSQP